MPNHDFEYVSMKKHMDSVRKVLKEEQYNNPHIIGNQDTELSDRSLNSQNDDKKITLDNNQTATVVSDSQDELAGNITMGLQTILNGFMEAMQGTVNNIDMMTVHISDSAMILTIKVTMQDNQPMVFNINSANKSIQAKYDNFLEINEKNLGMLTSAYKYFNPQLMGHLQGAVSGGM
jgi:hypothetical protein